MRTLQQGPNTLLSPPQVVAPLTLSLPVAKAAQSKPMISKAPLDGYDTPLPLYSLHQSRLPLLDHLVDEPTNVVAAVSGLQPRRRS